MSRTQIAALIVGAVMVLAGVGVVVPLGVLVMILAVLPRQRIVRALASKKSHLR